MSENRTPDGYNQQQSTGYSNNQGLTPVGGQNTGAGAAPAEDKGYGAKLADEASSAKDYVADKVSAIGDKLSDLKNTDIKEVATQAKDYARQNPGQAILISAAAGLVLGLLIRGGRRS